MDTTLVTQRGLRLGDGEFNSTSSPNTQVLLPNDDWAMGHRGDSAHPEVQANLLKILEACQNAGVPCATGATAEEVPMRLEQGFRIIITSPVKSNPGLTEGRRISGR